MKKDKLTELNSLIERKCVRGESLTIMEARFLFGAEAVLDELKEALESLKSKDED